MQVVYKFKQLWSLVMVRKKRTLGQRSGKEGTKKIYISVFTMQFLEREGRIPIQQKGYLAMRDHLHCFTYLLIFTEVITNLHYY